MTDHKPLKASFEKKYFGAIRINRTKLLYQVVDSNIVRRSKKLKPIDYLSRNSKIANDYIDEAIEDAKLLYYLRDDQYIMNNMTLRCIIDKMKTDETLHLIINLYLDTKSSVPSYVFNSLTVLATGSFLQGERIVLSQLLHKLAVKCTHSMRYLGCSDLKRQIRSHSAFQKLYYYANSGEKNCKDGQLYAEKGTKSPFFPVYVPDQAYDVVSMDFFEPVPSGEHKLVVQDLCTKYLAAV